MIIPSDHPYWHVRSLVENSDIDRLDFSYYHYRPQSLLDERISFSLDREQYLDMSKMALIFEQCPDEYDLAIHSIVQLKDGEYRHIPMIDMSTSSRAIIQHVHSYIGEELFKGFTWYKSGRSFHGYGEILLRYIDWMKMNGALLLANKKGLPPTVDPRWIGHRLVAGYSALRWTKNTDHYLASPRKL